ncbi:D-glucuronyl C5-epimerase family protein [Photobacterium lipolyticum]|uniref:D-glucuronyl C5-epimerase C-terminal domain-containing protein n=1 Tax=Photobacterium lipolyticum TaxID=266810 RepID=A0A2T3MV86_9GAMM|nr:D-glucuronyl C5-epimerase family protein [Photobacterium lipolyticum]PSW03862.1 hypothetical protein C9I89_15840 [Photobacterium lipolyticum]
MIKENLFKMLTLFKQDDYWHGKQKEGQFYDVHSLKGYYNDLTKKVLTESHYSIEEIVPKVKVGSESFFHPVTVCQVGLGAYDLYLKKQSDIHKKQVKSCVNWLIENSKTNSEKTMMYWTVPYNFKLFNMQKDFVSGLIQGQAISLLVRAYELFKDERYFNASYNALEKMIQPVSEDGCRLDGTYLYEEYPNKGEKNLVLNGAISAFWGVYDLYIYTKDSRILDLKNKSQKDLVDSIFQYDAGYYSRYCLKKNKFYYTNIASPYYHKEHIEQLKVLIKMTNNKDLILTLSNFEKYNNLISLNIAKINKGICLIMQKIMRVR